MSSYSPFSSHFASTPNASENLLMVSGFGCSSFRSYLPTREPDIPIFWPSCSIDRCCFFRVSLTLKPKFSVIPIDGRNVPIGISNACAIFWSASIFGVLTPRSYCWIVIVAISTFTASSLRQTSNLTHRLDLFAHRHNYAPPLMSGNCSLNKSLYGLRSCSPAQFQCCSAYTVRLSAYFAAE